MRDGAVDIAAHPHHPRCGLLALFSETIVKILSVYPGKRFGDPCVSKIGCGR